MHKKLERGRLIDEEVQTSGDQEAKIKEGKES